MKPIALLLLASCGGKLIAPGCAPPETFLTCDPDESPAYLVCWSADRTDWVVYPDGTYIHENRVSIGADGPMQTTELCRGSVL